MSTALPETMPVEPAADAIRGRWTILDVVWITVAGWLAGLGVASLIVVSLVLIRPRSLDELQRMFHTQPGASEWAIVFAIVDPALLAWFVWVRVIRKRGCGWREIGFRPVGWRPVAVAVALAGLSASAMLFRRGAAIPDRVGLVLVAAVLSGLAASVTEEVFFRGLLYRPLRSRMAAPAAILITSVLFTAVHFPWTDAFRVLDLLLFGIACAWLVERTASVYPAVVLHATYNLAVSTLIRPVAAR